MPLSDFRKGKRSLERNGTKGLGGFAWRKGAGREEQVGKGRGREEDPAHLAPGRAAMASCWALHAPELGCQNTSGFCNSPALKLTSVSSQGCHICCLSLRY